MKVIKLAPAAATQMERDLPPGIYRGNIRGFRDVLFIKQGSLYL